jgi:hypothetical protein
VLLSADIFFIPVSLSRLFVLLCTALFRADFIIIIKSQSEGVREYGAEEDIWA